MRNAKASMALALSAGMIITIAPGVSAQDDSATMAECNLEGTTPVTLQLQWVTQAQFAGFFAAHDLCFWAERGLDVTVQELDTTGPGPQVIGSEPNGPEFTIAWVPKVLQLRQSEDAPSDLVDIGQHLTRSGTLALAWADSGINSVADWAGKTVGVWPAGNEYEMTAAIKQAGLGPDDFNQVDNFFDMSDFLTREQDVAAAMIYNEYAQVLEAENPETGQLYQPEDLTVFDFKDPSIDTAMLQDAIWARESWLAEPGNEDIAVRFLAGAYEGWQYCRDNVEACTNIVLANAPILGKSHQLWQMNEINGLIWPAEGGIGTIPEATWNKTVEIALDAGIISREPSDSARRSDLSEQARALVDGDLVGADFQKIHVDLLPGGE